MNNSLFSLNRKRDGERAEDLRESDGAHRGADGRAPGDERAAAREQARERAERAAREQAQPERVHGEAPAGGDAAAREHAEQARRERAEEAAARQGAGAEPERASREPSSPDRQRHDARESASSRPEPHQPGGSHALGTSHLGARDAQESWQRWRQIQADFVDQPRRAVSDAHALVGEVLDGIIRQFERERGELEQRWSRGEDVSTEDLRRCLQTYRDFFGRLLANVEARPS